MTARTLRRTLLAAATTLVLAGLAQGCGSAGSGGSGGAKDATTSGAKTSSGSSPRSVAGDEKLTKDNFASVMAQAIKDEKTAHVDMTIGTTMSASGDVSYAGAGASMRMTMSMGAHKMELRFVDGVMYMQIPGLTPAGKFMMVTKDTPGLGAVIGQLQSFGPGQSVEAMRTGVKDLKDVGRDTIDGLAVEHYRVTVDTAAVVKKMGMPASDTSQLPKDIAYDLYVDHDNLLRRAVVEVAGQEVRMDATDWGKPVHVRAPSALQIVKAPAGMAS